MSAGTRTGSGVDNAGTATGAIQAPGLGELLQKPALSSSQ